MGKQKSERGKHEKKEIHKRDKAHSRQKGSMKESKHA